MRPNEERLPTHRRRHAVAFLESALPVSPDLSTSRLEELIARAMLRDRHRLLRRLQGARRAEAGGRLETELVARIEAAATASAERAARRAEGVPRVTYPEDLPVAAKKEEIAAAIGEYQVVVVCGETGSGKTTQIPKICLEVGRGVHGLIGHTQPRRIAARTVAKRIADELGQPLGNAVGYKVRFNDVTSPDGYIKLMTDGILLAETQGDRFLNEYDTIIIDEAHERSLNIDFLLGHLHNLLPRRPELKLVITSATIDPGRFSRHFGDCPIINVSGRTYPVEVRYRPLFDEADGAGAAAEMTDAIVQAVEELARDPMVGGGDTLVFLSGEREIRETAKALYDASGGGHHARMGRYEVLPLYARLNTAEQNRVFSPHHARRIVLATNVAETSLTVPGIRSVIDTGLARISRYSPRSKVQRLPIEPVSQASAEQRMGRCGRIGPGVCVRLYGEQDFAQRPAYTDPEILRTNLASVILQMKAFGLGDVESFPFIDPPDLRQVRDGYQTLLEIGALDEHRRLTQTGRILARMPIDPKLSRMVMAAERENCLEEMIVIAAALSIQDPRERPMEKQKQADEAHSIWRAGGSDFLTLLNLWTWFRTAQRERSRTKLRQLCAGHFLNYLRMLEWQDVQRQLREVVAGLGWKLNREPATAEQVHRAVIPGLLANVGRKGEGNEYEGLRGRKFYLFPGSVTFSSKPQWVVSAELVETTRLYARTVASVKPEWIEEAAGKLLKKTYGDPHWQKATGRVVAPMTVSLFGLNLGRRNVDYGKIDPKKSRSIFIRSALVEGDYESGAAFFRHNQRLVREVELMEAKTRRRDIMVEPETRFAFYDARIGAEAVDQRSFDRWRKSAERESRRLLFMQPEDLMSRAAGEVEGGDFPDEIDAGGIILPLAYRFDPGHPYDGVTATVALGELHAIDADRLDWLVPGLIEEKVTDLIRTLPKPIRTNFVPVPEFAHRAVVRMRYGDGSLLSAVAADLARSSGVQVSAGDFRPAELSDYLRLNLRVVDEAGNTVGHGRDVHELRRRLRVQARDKLADVPDPTWNRDQIVEWDVGDLPERVELPVNGRNVQGFPALVDRGESVSLRLLESREAARAAHRRGVRRLLLVDYAREIRYQVEDLGQMQQMRLHFAPIGDVKRLREHLAEAVGDRLFLGIDAADIRTAAAFEERVNAAWGRLGEVVREVGATAAAILEKRHEVHLKLGGEATRRRSDGATKGSDRRLAPIAASSSVHRSGASSLAVLPDILTPSLNDMREQLEHLVPGDFLLRTPAHWLVHIPRFLQGIEVRLAKLLDAGLERDSRAATAVFPYWKAYLDRLHTPDAGPLSPAWVEFRWLVEEYRISQFAQQLGTSMRVSEKVLAERLASLKQR